MSATRLTVLTAGLLIAVVPVARTGVAFSADNQAVLLVQAQSPQTRPNPPPPSPQPARLQPPAVAAPSQVETTGPQMWAGARAAQSSEEATGPPVEQQDPSDPLAPVNHKILDLNSKIDRQAFHPVASQWAAVVPQPARRRIHCFFDNVGFLPRFANAVFQLKLNDAGGELARFGINSTIGLAGLFDPADEWFGIKEHDNDFGKTLAAWGASEGWFVVMPITGPFDIRNVLGHLVDSAMNPMNYLAPGSAELYEAFAHSLEDLNQRAETLDKFEGVAPNSPDLYQAVRTNYLQQKRPEKPAAVSGGERSE